MPMIASLRWLPLGLFLVACSGSSGNDARGPEARLLVTTGTNVVEPAPSAAPRIDLAALGASRIQSHYRLTTPAAAPFAFELVTWRTDTSGTATIGVNHVRDGDHDIAIEPDSMARAGLVPSGAGLESDGEWTRVHGAGFVRLVLQGLIIADQVLAVQTEGSGVVVIEIAIGAESAINRPLSTEPDVTGIALRETVYSSNAWQFGKPTVAVSGDRTSIVCYEGDRSNPTSDHLYEQRLQHAVATGAVTGGAELLQAAPGCWRDHEVVALYNVLGVVRAEEGGVRVRLSFDRGATFAQDVQVLPGLTQSRLVQAAMAGDYSLAIGAWRQAAGGGMEFVLVEGRAVAFDTFGSPTWFQFEPAQVLFTEAGEVAPLTTGIAWSEGGDLVVAFASNRFGTVIGQVGWGSTTEYRCAVRPYGGVMVTKVVDSETFFGCDPTVVVLGQGASLRIFYAYEVRNGVRLATSEDAGGNWTIGPTFGQAGDYLPSVFAREVGGQTRVDVLYLASRSVGTELHRAFWTAWPGSPREEQALTRASMTQAPTPPGGWSSAPLTLRFTQVNFMGYDAVRDGDQLVIAYDEHTFDSFYLLPWTTSGVSATTTGGILPPSYSPATPPPLAPGLTLPMPAPVAEHSHQLKVLRLQ